MMRFARAAIAPIAIATLAAGTLVSTGAQAGCSMTSAGGIGVSKDIATFMSNKALHNMTEKLGEKGTGKVTTTCTGEVLLVNCVSKQRTCK